MSALDLCLIMLTFVFWAGSVVYYFRVPIYEWLDNRFLPEPVTIRLRAWFNPGQR